MSSDVYRQLDFLTQEVAGIIERQGMSEIDPVDYGELKGTVAALKVQVEDMRATQTRMNEKLDIVLDKLSEAKGGWKLLMALGGAGATLGGALTWFFSHTIHIGPKG